MTDSDIIKYGQEVLDIELDELKKLSSRIDGNFVTAVRLMLECKGKVIISGVGKSGAIARKMAATFSSTGTPALFLHAAEGAHGDLGTISGNDVVICISKSGNSEEVNALLPPLKKLNVPIIGITGNKGSFLAKFSDVVLDISVSQEACPNDLAPTASTTLTMVLGDALAIALLKKRKFTKDDFAFLHPAGSLGKRLLYKVNDLMETGEKVGKIAINRLMKDAVVEMANKRGVCTIVDDENKLVGIITTGDLNRLVKSTEHFFNIPVKEVMNEHPKTVLTGTLAYSAYKKMEKFSVIVLPVVDSHNNVLGVVHLHDLMKAGIV